MLQVTRLFKRTVWLEQCDLVALRWFKGFTAAVDTLQLVGGVWECLWTYSNTPQCQATVHYVCLLTYMTDVSKLHLYQGKCDVGFCGEMSTYYGTWQKASKTWACKLHVSTHTHARMHLCCECWGKNTTFCLSWRLQHQCHHIRIEQEKVILLFKAQPCQQ